MVLEGPRSKWIRIDFLRNLKESRRKLQNHEEKSRYRISARFFELFDEIRVTVPFSVKSTKIGEHERKARNIEEIENISLSKEFLRASSLFIAFHRFSSLFIDFLRKR